jgi:hypothetical protein
MNAYILLVAKRPLEHQDTGGWIILKWILEWNKRIDLAEDRNQWRALGEHGNKPADSIKFWKFLSTCNNWWHLEVSCPWI